MTDEWVTVVGWAKFQHYGNRKPVWIKVYLDLLDKPEYMDLTPTACALLHRIWLATATKASPKRCTSITRKCGNGWPRRHHWEELVHAGFIELSASKPASNGASEKREVLRTSPKSASAPAHARGAAQTLEEKNEDPLSAALAEAGQLASGWESGDSVAFDDALDEIARRHHTRIPYTKREELWDTAFH